MISFKCTAASIWAKKQSCLAHFLALISSFLPKPSCLMPMITVQASDHTTILTQDGGTKTSLDSLAGLSVMGF
jgi:hypothetical protein